MGREYTIKFKKDDLKSLKENPTQINSLDKLLRAIPYFYEQKDDSYFYSETPKDKNRWPSVITINNDQLDILIYGGEHDSTLMKELMESILHYCYHLEIEEK